MLILVPDTTSEPMSTDAPESARNGLSPTPPAARGRAPSGSRTPAPATPESKTTPAVSGTATRRMRTCRLWRTAARKARFRSARPNRATMRGPPGGTSDTAVKEFIPEPHPPKRIRRPHAILASSAPYGRSQIWPGRGTGARPKDNGPGQKSGLIEGDSADKLPNPYDSAAPENLGMGKDVLGGPAGEVEPHPIRKEAKTGRREVRATLADEDRVELLLERVQVQHVRCRVGELRVGQRFGAPIGELLLLRQVDAQHLAHEILEAVLVGVGTRDPRGDLGAIDRGGHDAQPPLQHTEIEAGEMKDLENRSVGEKFGQIGRCARGCRDLHHVGGAIARRQLHDAQPIADRIEPHGFGVDRHRGAAVVREAGQIAAMQADSHDGSRTGDAANLVPRRGLEPPRLAALVPETSASTNSATWAAWRLGTEQACGCQIGGTHALYSVKPILYSAIEALQRA